MDENAVRQAFDDALASYEQEFETFFLAQLLGLEFSYVDDTCVVEMEVRDFMFNPQGSLHGGIIALIMDISMGHLLNKIIGPGATLETKTQYLKPIGLGHISATGRRLQSGRSIQFLKSEVHNAERVLMAFATATWKTART